MKKNIVILILSFFLIMFGMVLTVSEVVNFEVKDDFNDSTLTTMTTSYDFNLSGKSLDINTNFTKEPSVIIDNSLDKGTIKIKVTYYNELISINKFLISNENGNTLNINVEDTQDFDTVKKLIGVTLTGLRQNEVYNYANALKPTVNVYINDADKAAVKIRN